MVSRRARVDRRRRIITALVASLVVLVPLVYSVNAVLGGNREHAQAIEQERHGVSFLGPMIQLVAALADAKTVAVGGRRVDPRPLTAAVDAVDAAARRHAGPLRVELKWSSLRDNVRKLADQRVAGLAAERTYAPTVAQALDLIHSVGHTSDLLHDGNQTRYHLGQMLLVHLPQTLVSAGAAVDTYRLIVADRRSTAQELADLNTVLDRVNRHSADMASQMRTAVDSSEDGVTGPRLAGVFDQYEVTATVLAPPRLTFVQRPSVEPALPGAREDLREATLAFADAVLKETDRLLVAEQSQFGRERFVMYVVLALGVLAVAGLLWLRVPPAAPPRWRLPDDARGPEDPDDGDGVVDASSLFGSEMVRAGRGIRTRRDERDAPV